MDSPLTGQTNVPFLTDIQRTRGFIYLIIKDNRLTIISLLSCAFFHFSVCVCVLCTSVHACAACVWEHVWVMHECVYAHTCGDCRLKLALVLDPSRRGLLVRPTAHQYSCFCHLDCPGDSVSTFETKLQIGHPAHLAFLWALRTRTQAPDRARDLTTKPSLKHYGGLFFSLGWNHDIEGNSLRTPSFQVQYLRNDRWERMSA